MMTGPYAVTRDEIERATEEMVTHRSNLDGMSKITSGTCMRSTILATAHMVPLDIALSTAYHHGIRTGLQIAADRVADAARMVKQMKRPYPGGMIGSVPVFNAANRAYVEKSNKTTHTTAIGERAGTDGNAGHDSAGTAREITGAPRLGKRSER